MDFRMDDVRHPFQAGIQHFGDPNNACHHSQGSCFGIADMKDDAGDYYGDGGDGMNAGIVFLPDEYYDTRQVVYRTVGLSALELKEGYDSAYSSFYSWTNILRASLGHDRLRYAIKHFAYAGGWKKFEPMWNFLIKTQGLNKMLPLLEAILSKVKSRKTDPNAHAFSLFPAIA